MEIRDIFLFILCCVIAYGIGTLSPSLFLSKLKKKDLRAGGSGNLGASNTTLLMGWKYGVIVGLFDILKGTVSVLAVRFLLPELIYLPYAVGLCAVLGHIYPFYLKGKGGKGFATYMGIILGLDWRFFIIIGIAVILLTLIFDYIVLGTFTSIVTFPIWLSFFGEAPFGVLVVLPLSIIIFIKHRANIRRMITKEELGIRATFKKKKQKSEQSE